MVVFDQVLNMQGIIKFQARLYQAVEHLNPLHLVDYLFRDIAGSLWNPIGAFFDGIVDVIHRSSSWAENALNIPHIIIVLLSFPFVIISLIVQLALFFVIFIMVLASSPVSLPIIVISKGYTIEAVLIVVIFIPMWVFMARVLFYTGSVEFWVRAYFWYLTSLMALVVTSLFYLLVQYAMLGLLWAVGKLLPAAPAGAATSAYLSFAIQCAERTAEHSLTERVVRTVRRWLLR
jgi:hypothetical protein